MKRLIIISVMMCLLLAGICACRPESRSSFSTPGNESRSSFAFAGNESDSIKLQAYDEKQIENFNNQSTSKDIRITGGPPAEQTVSGLDGLKVD